MATLFWFALVLGGGLLLVSTLGHLLGDAFGDQAGAPTDGADAGQADVQVDSDAACGDADADTDQGAGVHHAHIDQQGFRFLSLRTATYFLFGFGAAGVLLTYAWKGTHPVIAGATGIACGLLAAWLSASLFHWVGAGDSGALAGDRALVGATGVVVLPLPANGTGKVLVHSAGRELELLARPIASAPGDPGTWKGVMVVDVADGVAVVTPFDAPET